MRKILIIMSVLTYSTVSADEYIGNFSGNMFDGDSINNEFSLMNNEFYPYGLKNQFGVYANEFSPYGYKNQFSTMGPRLYGGPFDENDDY